jgi:dipeptidyl aminopeptidase/acylaminoacyl peptidase
MTPLRILLIASLAGLAIFAAAQKKPLDHSVYDSWKSVQGTQLSDDGKWILYRIAPQEGDALAEIKTTSGNTKYTIDRATNVQFSRDGKYVIATVIPTFAETREAKRKKVKPEDQPKNSLVILDLSTGQQTKIDRVTSFMLADDDAGWIVYKPEPPKPAPAPAAKPEEKKEEPKKEEGTKEEPKKKADHKPGDVVVLRQLATGKEERIEDVVQYRFSKDGKVLAYTLSTKDGSGDGIVWYDLPADKKTVVVKQMGHYPRLALDEKATKLAYVTDKDDYMAKKPTNAVYIFQGGKNTMLAKEGSAGVPKDWWVPDTTQLSFSDSAKRLIFSTQPKPAEEKKDDTPDDEKVSVDIWNWQDPTLQPQQLLMATQERGRTYTAIADLGSMKVTQLATKEMPNVSLGAKSDAPIGLGMSGLPYQAEASWDTGYTDYYLVNTSTGEAKKVLSKFEGNASLSPSGKWIYAYNDHDRKGMVIDPRTGAITEVTKGIPYPIYDEQNDVPEDPNAYGLAGWLKGDDRLFIYDNFDIWSIDPTAKTPPVNVTNGLGRSLETHLRYVRTDPEEDSIDPNKPMLLSANNERTKADGFYTDMPSGNAYPTKILVEDKLLGAPVKAKDADVIYYTRGDFDEYPNVWLADSLGFQNPRQVSDANPQQKDYIWGKSELIQYTTNDGLPLQGILIKPENFDYAKKYPMIVYFYERSSETLHQYRSPAPSASIINPTMAASNGYLVLIPDIAYKVGYPGESAMSSVMPAVQEVVRRGYVDPKKIGLDGQSWGGYQIAWMITETDMFACAFAGAPVANMTSAYGGIRWGSGLVREFQYERGQSRIGYSLWETPLRYLENSPVFYLDKVKTPVLIMANDKDGAVPWYQGIEMFTGLRRLQKPAWLLVYNNEDHNLVERKNRKDLSIRKHQFFDHFLKGAPMPDWMSKGVPAVDKGKNYGLEVPKEKG